MNWNLHDKKETKDIQDRVKIKETRTKERTEDDPIDI